MAPALERQWLLGAARFIVLICVCVVMTVLTRSDEYGLVFLNLNNLLNIVRNASILIIIGVGQTITLTAKDVDLSVGSVLSLTSVVAAIMLNRYGVAFPVAIFTALLIGALLGLINGLLITQVGLPPFIATYGTLWVLFGFAYLILQGAVIYGFPAGFRVIGNGKLLGIPMPIIVMAMVFSLCYFVLLPHDVGPALLRHRGQHRDGQDVRHQGRADHRHRIRHQRILVGTGRFGSDSLYQRLRKPESVIGTCCP